MQIFAVLVPIVGLGAFIWWAGRDIMKGTVRILQSLALKNFLLFRLLHFLTYGIYFLHLI
jgi:hypothetical protein